MLADRTVHDRGYDDSGRVLAMDLDRTTGSEIAFLARDVARMAVHC